MSFVTNGSSWDRSKLTIDITRLRPVFQHLAPEVREQIAKAIHTAYPDLLVTAMPNGTMYFEKL